MVLLLLCSGVIWAQNPKSAEKNRANNSYKMCWQMMKPRLDGGIMDSLSLTDPSIPNRTLSLLMSRWITWFAWRNSRACKHCGGVRPQCLGGDGKNERFRYHNYTRNTVPLCRQQQFVPHPCRFLLPHRSESLQQGIPSPQRAHLQPRSCTHTQENRR